MCTDVLAVNELVSVRISRRVVWLLCALCVSARVWAVNALTNPACFVISDEVVQSNVPGYGAEYDDPQRINNWTLHPGMEPVYESRCIELTGGGSDATGDYAVGSTRYYDSYDSGYCDGARYQLFRESTASSNITKIREGIVPAGGFVAAGYMSISHLNLNAYPPNTEATDDFLTGNGETWYYAVRARDTGGKWSAYSAPVAGVAAHSASNNGPRMLTVSVPNPVLGRVYTVASPLTRISARGGTPPYTWSIAGGAWPAGLSNQLTDASGRSNAVVGVCNSTNQATVTLRVTDSASNNHTRVFTVFRAAPASDPATPQAPSNVVVESNNGFLHIRWDAVADADIDYYQVYRSRQPAAAHMERVYLDGTGPVPGNGDILMLHTMFTSSPPFAVRSIRVASLQKETSWIMTSGINQTFEPHPGVLPAAFQQEYPGQSCLRVSTANAGEFLVRHFKMAYTGDYWWSSSQIIPGSPMRMSCWVYGDGLASNTLRFKLMNYVDRTITGVVNGAWTKLTLDFTVTNFITSGTSVDGPSFYFRGPGAVYLDNVMVYNTAAAGGACGESEHVLGMWREYTAGGRPWRGALRQRYDGGGFANAISPPVMSTRAWSINAGAQAEADLHIHTVLQACYRSGGTPQTRTLPWITVNLRWTDGELLDLVEFLAGPTNTPFGALRAALRGGVATPWVDEFRTIYLEFGNEPWNSPLFFGFRGGFSQASGRTYGRFCNYMLQQMRGSPHWSDVLTPTLGGWAASLGANGFTQSACEECPLARHVGVALYLGGWEAGYGGQVGGTTWSDDGLQQWTVYNDTATLGKPMIDATQAMLQRLAAKGRTYSMVAYECGPSYLMNGLNNVALTADEQAVSRRYGRTLAAAVGTFDYLLYASLRGFKEMQFYAYTQDRGLWCSHTHVHTGYRPHPAWLAATLVNHHIAARDLLATAHTALPVFDLITTNTSGQQVVKTNVPLCSVYAAREGATYAVAVINKKLDGAHNGLDFGDGYTPVQLVLPFTNTAKITLYKLAGNLRATNLDGYSVSIVTQHISVAAFSNVFTVNEATGGAAHGMPPGIFIYVFGDDPGTPPFITRHPQSTTIQVDASTNFTVEAGGTAPLSYQWIKDGASTLNTGPVYSIAHAQEHDAGVYWVVVSNAYGSVTSDGAVLNVIPEPLIMWSGVLMMLACGHASA